MLFLLTFFCRLFENSWVNCCNVNCTSYCLSPFWNVSQLCRYFHLPYIYLIIPMHGMGKINNEIYLLTCFIFWNSKHPSFTSLATWIDNFAKLSIILTLNTQLGKFKYKCIHFHLLLTNFVKVKHLCKYIQLKYIWKMLFFIFFIIKSILFIY